jgi:hypothetical protein
MRRDYSSPSCMSSTSTTPCAATTRLPAASTLHQPHRTSGASAPRAGLLSTTSPTLHVRVPRHVARLIVDNFASRGSSLNTLRTPRVRVPRHVARLVVDYFAYAARPGASARRAAHRRLLRVHHASGCLGTSHGTSRGSSSTTSPTPRVRVPQLVARLVIDYFAYAARLDASARRTARHAALRRLLRVRRAFECLGTLRGSSSTTSRTLRVRVPQHVARLVVDYFTYAVRPGVSARRTARRAAHRRLLHLRCAFGCLGLSRGSSSTTSRTPRVRIPQHVAWPVARLVIDYFAYAACPGASARCVARRRLLHVRCASRCLGTLRGSSSTTSCTPCVRVSQHVARHVARLVVDYFTYVARPGASSCRVAHR